MTSPCKTATAISPASIANLAVGFDILGQACDGCHDQVTATKTDTGLVELGKVSGMMDQLPTGKADNTALRGVAALLRAQNANFGVRIDLIKGIPKSAGLGGSAASAVASVLAANALLDAPLDTQALFPFALEGERASSNPPPADNVAACLYGGLVMVLPGDDGQVVHIPAPKNIEAVVFHPALEIETGASRKALQSQIPLSQTIAFAAHLAAFTAACYQNDIALLRQIMRDVLIEPQRGPSIAPFADVQRAAMAAGAISCSISGSGPSIFAWVEPAHKMAIQTAMAGVFAKHQITAAIYASALNAKPARLVPSP